MEFKGFTDLEELIQFALWELQTYVTIKEEEMARTIERMYQLFGVDNPSLWSCSAPIAHSHVVKRVQDFVKQLVARNQGV